MHLNTAVLFMSLGTLSLGTPLPGRSRGLQIALSKRTALTTSDNAVDLAALQRHLSYLMRSVLPLYLLTVRGC